MPATLSLRAPLRHHRLLRRGCGERKQHNHGNDLNTATSSGELQSLVARGDNDVLAGEGGVARRHAAALTERGPNRTLLLLARRKASRSPWTRTNTMPSERGARAWHPRPPRSLTPGPEQTRFPKDSDRRARPPSRGGLEDLSGGERLASVRAAPRGGEEEQHRREGSKRPGCD